MPRLPPREAGNQSGPVDLNPMALELQALNTYFSAFQLI